MKKLASLFAALALLLALAAPGAAADTAKPTPTPPALRRSWTPGRAITAISGCGTSSSRCRPTRPPL